MLGVDYRDIASDARTFVKEQRAVWRTADDSSNAIVKAYGITGVPQTFFIRPDGTIAVRFYSDIPDAADFRTALGQDHQPLVDVRARPPFLPGASRRSRRAG